MFAQFPHPECFCQNEPPKTCLWKYGRSHTVQDDYRDNNELRAVRVFWQISFTDTPGKNGGSLCENIEWSLNADVLQWRWLGGVGEPATCAQQNLQNKDFYIRTAGVGFGTN